MKRKFGIKGFLLFNYLLVFIIIIIFSKLSSISSNFFIENTIYKNSNIDAPTISEMYNEDFNKIDTRLIEDLGAWLEILDENNRVIFVKGNKKDDIMQYDDKSLRNMLSVDSNDRDNNYLGLISVISNKKQTILIKFDRNQVNYNINPKLKLKSKSFYKVYMIKFVFLLIYLIGGIFVYSILSSTFIINPLKKFVIGIKKMKQLKYGVKLEVQGLKELEEVQNEFNEMSKHLQDAEEENKKIDESKKRLLVDISHDLKTPITSIQGFARLLIDEEVISEEQRKEFLNIIYNKSVYATLLIDDLFQLSKLQDSGYGINLKQNDFCEWTRELIGDYYEEFNSKNFNLQIDISECGIVTKFDEKLMKRAVSNILNNCLKYNIDGTTVRISCYKEAENLFLEIGDNGDGIEESIKDIIFEPFIKSQEKKSEGSGLGLAITKKIIEKHDGVIVLASTESEKTIFKISIPICIN